MNYYDSATLTLEQKKQLHLLVSLTDKKVAYLHDWIVGTNDYNLSYVTPVERQFYTPCVHGKMQNTKKVVVVDVYKLWGMIPEFGGKIPVNGVEFIKMLNLLGVALDDVYKVE